MTPIEKMNAAIKEMARETSSLYGYAAEAALEVLVQNWEDAVVAEESLPELVGDIDRVIERLNDFKAKAALIAAEEADSVPKP